MTTTNFELKPVKNKKQKNLCATCLSFVNSNLQCPISEDIKGFLKCLMYDFGIDDFFKSLPPGKELKLCYECNATLKDMITFKQRVQHSFSEIKKYWCSNEKYEDPRAPRGPVIVYGQGIKPTTLTPQQGTLNVKVPKEHMNEKQSPIGIIKEEVADIDNSNDNSNFIKSKTDTNIIFKSEAAARPIEADNVLKNFKEDVADIAYLNDNVFIRAETDIDTSVSVTTTRNHSVTTVLISNMDPITNVKQNKLFYTCLSLVGFTMEHKMVPITEHIKGVLTRLLYDYDINGFFELVPPGKVLEMCCKCNVVLKDMAAFKKRVQKSFNEFRKYWGLKKKITEQPVIVLQRNTPTTNTTSLSCTTKVKDKKGLINESQNPKRTVNEELTDIVNTFADDFIKEENDTDMMYVPEAAAEPIKNNEVLKIDNVDAADITDRNINVFIKTETDMCTTYLPEPTVMKHNENSIENVNVSICNAKFKDTDKKSNHNIAMISSVVKHITIEHFSKEAGEDPDIEKSIQSTILFRKQDIDLPVEISNTNKSNSYTPNKRHQTISKRNDSFDEKKVKVEGEIGIGEEVMLKPKCEDGTFTIDNPSVATTLESPNVVLLSPKLVSAQSIVQGSMFSSDSDSENALESDKASSTYGRQAMTLQGQSYYSEHCQQKLKRRQTKDEGTAQTKKITRHNCFFS